MPVPSLSGADPPPRPASSRVDQVANVLAMTVPFALLGLAAWRAWGGSLRWSDVVVLAVLYVLTGLGVTVGFHRLFTHRSFKAAPAVRLLLAVLGSAAVEGPLIEWVSNHRKHHSFSDEPGDPHSPHGHGSGFRGALRGLLHAHLGWILEGDAAATPERYAKDLLADPVARFVDKWFVLWVLAGLALPFGVGVLLAGSVSGGLTALLWGGAVRIFLLHHATFSINSLCHFFGARPYETGDESRNLRWLALPTLGEAWHNNHHAFPTSARHGRRASQPDPSWWAISALRASGLAWDVVSPSPAREAAAALGGFQASARASLTGTPQCDEEPGTPGMNERTKPMFKHVKRGLVLIAGLAALALGGSALAGAATSSTPSSSSTATPAPSGTQRPSGSQAPPAFQGPAHGTAAHEDAEKAVTGAAATKAQEAAVKSVGSGTAGDVTTDLRGSGFETTVTKSDGTKVEVHLDSSYNVMQGPGGPGGHGVPGGPPPGAYGA